MFQYKGKTLNIHAILYHKVSLGYMFLTSLDTESLMPMAV